jgi:hypothetical protein
MTLRPAAQAHYLDGRLAEEDACGTGGRIGASGGDLRIGARHGLRPGHTVRPPAAGANA